MIKQFLFFSYSRMTINMSSKRFFVGNLFNDVTDQDLKKLFKNYGTCTNIEIKQKNDVDGNMMTKFAFVTMDNISDDQVVQCIKQNNNLKWKKHLIKVQVAQESFLSRLQRERSEKTQKSGSNLESKLRTLASTELFSTTASNKKTITFNEEDEEEEDITVPVNKLERSAKKRVYHSSSSEGEDEDSADFQAKTNNSGNVLSKLESFNGGFWCDDNDNNDDANKKSSDIDKPMVQESTNAIFKNSSEGAAGFSLLSAYGVEKNAGEEDKNEVSSEVSKATSIDTFAWKLKEKAALESAQGDLEPFFFTDKDSRFKEGQGFLHLDVDMSDLRTKYEEKRPLLASIIKKKVKSRSKKQEKLAFTATTNVKSKRKRFNIKRKSGKKFKH